MKFLRQTAFLLIAAGLIAFASEKALAEDGPDPRPMLRIETGMHTAIVRTIALDKACRIAATGSDDKTVRLWTLPESGEGTPKLLRTIRVPIGEGHNGKVFAVAFSPDGKWLAVGGWDAHYTADNTMALSIYEVDTGRLAWRIGSMNTVIHYLAFSPNGRYVAGTMHAGEGLRVWDIENQRQVAEDRDYNGSDSYGAAFGSDGTLFTVANDGYLRRYGPDFNLESKAKTEGGAMAHSVAVHPSGKRVAIGFDDTTAVEVRDAHSLKRLFAADTKGLDNGSLGSVAWSADGTKLYAGGKYWGGTARSIAIWDHGGQGPRRLVPFSNNTILQFFPCKNRFAIPVADPGFGIIDENGKRHVWIEGVTPDMRDKKYGAFTVSRDGTRLRFGLSYGIEEPVLFDLGLGEVTDAPQPVAGLITPKTDGLNVSGWENNFSPKLNGKPLTLRENEASRSLAVAPDTSRLVLGADFSLRAFTSEAVQKWQVDAPGYTWGVNITANGKLAVAAYADGTIRWHRLSDGKELLALFIHRGDKRFIAWTPKGYYLASAGAEDLIGWHLNRGWDEPADFFPASRFRDQFSRPDIVKRVLTTLDEDVAIDQANREADRKNEEEDLRKRLPPVITVLSPVDGSKFDTGQLSVRFSLRSPSGLPVARVRALVDGRPAEMDTRALRGLDKVKDKEEEFTLAVTVPKRNFELSLIAETKDKASEPAKLTLDWGGKAEEPEFKPNLYALVIGVANYDDENIRLKWSSKDAADFADLLEQQKGLLYGKVEVRRLIDKDATAAAILDALEWIEGAASRDDRVIVYLAGHGVTDGRQDYYFLPVNAKLEQKGALMLPSRSTSVTKSQILDSLRKTLGHALFVFDTCHSGLAASGGRLRGTAEYTPFINELRSAENGVLVLASSEGRELSQERDDWQNGAFTLALKEGLEGAADTNPKDGVITFAELNAYVAERVKQLTGGTQHPIVDVVRQTRNLPVAAVPH